MITIKQVLDKGFVRLVDHMGSDVDISRAARVSYNAPGRKEDDKLIGYLLRNHHTSPFEAVIFTFEIKCPIFIARQWHRHRTWSYNEVSARYTELPDEFYIPDDTIVGMQSKDNKQARDIHVDERIGSRNADLFCEALEMHSREGFRQYKIALETGIPRELARCFLGLNTYTRFFGTVDLHNLMHFLRLRLHPHAQYEIQEYGRAMRDLIKPIVPITMKHFLNEPIDPTGV